MFTLHRTTRIAICCSAAVLTSCAKKDNAAMDTTASSSASTTTTTTAPAPAPAPVNLADFAGKWDVRSVPVSGDTTPTTYVLTATSGTTGWTMKFPGRAPIAARITVAGDSVEIDAGPYLSVRRKGVTVTTNGGLRVQNGKLVGSTTAHYKVKTADSVLVLNSTGTRAK
ncbi:MAG TPA: hypothetical protein VGQ98_06115 [Gemmatimonadaceae bacterium]|nr:hypothetical protein [Gemmatimonadaceae bacterium]